MACIPGSFQLCKSDCRARVCTQPMPDLAVSVTIVAVSVFVLLRAPDDH